MSVKSIVAKAQEKPGEPIYVDAAVAKLIKAEPCEVPDFCTAPVSFGEPAKGAIAYFNGSPVFVGPKPEPKAKPSKEDSE